MDITVVLYLIGGLILLVLGGDLLIKGAVRVASVAGVSPLVIGLTVVSFGTSAPELVVSLKASMAGAPDIAVANVVGSNIFNTLFILGLCAAIVPLVVSSQLIRLDVPLMIAASALFWIFGLDGNIVWWEGLILMMTVVSYTIFIVRKSRKETKFIKSEFAEEFTVKTEMGPRAILKSLALVLVGLGLLVLGGRWLVDGAVAIAKSWGVSETIIGLTIVAAGTSLPEVAASAIAALRGERDIAIGNVVGSNIFNLLLIIGVSSSVTPGGLLVNPTLLSLDIPIMWACAFVCLPLFFRGMSLGRLEGWMFLFLFSYYLSYLVLRELGNPLADVLKNVFFLYVMPVLGILLFAIFVQIWRNYRLRTTPPA